MDVDERSFRIALVADDLVNPEADGFDALEVLREEDWGVIQLPPAWYAQDVAAPMLEQVAEHVEEFARHGYRIVLVGNRPGLADALRRVGVGLPNSAQPKSADELRGFLTAQPPVDPALARGEGHTVQ
jgi:hypothetical protein